MSWGGSRVLHFNLSHEFDFLQDSAHLDAFRHFAFVDHRFSLAMHLPRQRFGTRGVAPRGLDYLSDDLFKGVDFIIEQNHLRRLLSLNANVFLLFLNRYLLFGYQISIPFRGKSSKNEAIMQGIN